MVLSRYRAHPGVPRACAVRDRRFAVAARCMLRIRAGSVHPVTAPPIEDGAVLVDDRGTIAAVGPNRCVPESPAPGAHVLEFPDAVLVPGLVNTHTHLELTHLRSEEHTSELQSLAYLVCRLLLEKKKITLPPNLSASSPTRRVHAASAGTALWT